MKKFYVGQQVYVGGPYGPLATILEINGNTLKVVDEYSTGWITEGDCCLVPAKKYEQLSLFGD